MANDFTAFKLEFETMLLNTTKLDATFKQKMGDRMKAAYKAEYDAIIAGGQPDNATTKRKFLTFKTFDGYWQDIWTAQSTKENVASVPPPDAWS